MRWKRRQRYRRRRHKREQRAEYRAALARWQKRHDERRRLQHALRDRERTWRLRQAGVPGWIWISTRRLPEDPDTIELALEVCIDRHHVDTPDPPTSHVHDIPVNVTVTRRSVEPKTAIIKKTLSISDLYAGRNGRRQLRNLRRHMSSELRHFLKTTAP